MRRKPHFITITLPAARHHCVSGTDIHGQENFKTMIHLPNHELMLKHAQTRDLAELTEHLVTLLIAGYTTDEQLVTLMNWMLQTGDTARPEAFLQELARRSPQHEEILMTIAQRLEQKAREEGILLGEQRGIEKGEREATLKIARTMLQSGIDRNTVMAMTGLTEEDLRRITH